MPEEYQHDNAVAQASAIGLLVQCFLAVALAVLWVSARFPSGGRNSVAQWLMLTGAWAEFGLGLVLCHSLYLFPRESPSRIVGGIGCLVIAGVQLATVANGLGLVSLFVYAIGISIAGWLMHRVSGASLSMHGEDVYQDALTTKVLLLLAPLLLLLGIVPMVPLVVMNQGLMRQGLAAMVVYSAIGMLGVCVVPILTIYLGFFVLRLRVGLALAATVLLVLLAAAPMILEWIQFASVRNSVWTTGVVLAYTSGLGLAYLPFHLRGFRPVWAKRKHRLDIESTVSFDDIH